MNASEAYTPRERALTMAQHDWHNGKIDEGQVITQARTYLDFLTAASPIPKSNA